MDRRSFIAASVAASFVFATPTIAQNAETDNLMISGAFTRASPKMAGAGAGFMTITSKGAADRLVGFKSPNCERPELHTHIHDNGMMRMRQVEAIDVPAGGMVELKPGSFHLMFIKLSEQLIEGDTVEATLIFEQAGEVPVTLAVKGPGAMN